MVNGKKEGRGILKRPNGERYEDNKIAFITMEIWMAKLLFPMQMVIDE